MCLRVRETLYAYETAYRRTDKRVSEICPAISIKLGARLCCKDLNVPLTYSYICIIAHLFKFKSFEAPSLIYLGRFIIRCVSLVIRIIKHFLEMIIITLSYIRLLTHINRVLYIVSIQVIVYHSTSQFPLLCST